MTDERLRAAYESAMAARGRPDRAHCPSAELLHALVRREGPEAVRLMTLDHAMACPHCRGEVELLRALRLAGEPAGSVPARRRPRWAIGVGAALAASLVVAVTLGPGRAAWDRERDDVMRGSGSALWLAAPGDGEVVPSHAPIAFAWHPGRGARDYVVELLAPDGGVVLTGTTSDSALTLAPAAPLAPGEYRWVVRARLADGTGQLSAARRLRVR